MTVLGQPIYRNNGLSGMQILKLIVEIINSSKLYTSNKIQYFILAQISD
jgi:hypothetical protein